MKFVPTVDFWSEEMKSQYAKGLTYTVRSPHAPDAQGASPHQAKLREQRAKLAVLVQQWRAQGKVKVAESDLPEASISGSGEVS